MYIVGGLTLAIGADGGKFYSSPFMYFEEDILAIPGK